MNTANTRNDTPLVTHITGDLFSLIGQVDALAHGVNCRGLMGKGIAPEFKRRWPQMYDAYRTACATGTRKGQDIGHGGLRVGAIMPWPVEPGLWVYNLATQDRPGRDARLSAVKDTLTLALDHASKHGVGSIAMPRIGAGIGGLSWPDVRDTIEATVASQRSQGTPVRVIVVSLPGS